MPRPPFLILFFATAWLLSSRTNAQNAASNSNDAIRVTVKVNADGSRTTYQYDNAKHEAIATTTGEEGAALGKVVYRTDDNGRFLSGVVFGPYGKFVFKTLYKYGAAGRLEEETQLTKENTVINKVVYKYDAAGKQIGYSIFDANGKLTSGTVSPAATASPKSDKGLGR